MTAYLSNNIGAVIAGVILLAFVVLGLRDIFRFSPRRIWAISSVGFRESVRRRVWLITPLAMLGVIAVSQLAHPFDEQDAIRQTTKYCLFASGVVVVLATLILACTNLPREIENRVIYTIVTKPPTRLEIVLGKTLGFARTAALILGIMGVFSYFYLNINAWQLQKGVRTKLANLPPADLSRETLQHYASKGLLGAETFAGPTSLQIQARAPKGGDPFRWIFGASEQYVAWPVDVPQEVFEQEARLIIVIQVATVQRPLTGKEIELEAMGRGSATKPATQGARMPPKPGIAVTLVDPEFYNLASDVELVDALAAEELGQAGKLDAEKPPNASAIELREMRPGLGRAMIIVPPKVMKDKVSRAPEKDGRRRMYVRIDGQTMATLFGFAADSVSVLAEVPGEKPVVLDAKDSAGKAAEPAFRSRLSTAGGQQLRGEIKADEAPVAVYTFRGVRASQVRDGQVPFEFRAKVERSAEADVTDAEAATHVELVIQNLKTGKASDPITIIPDVDRPTFFAAPANAIEGGDFDVLVRSRTEGHLVGLRSNTLQVVSSSQSFALNLLKSLLVLWLLSILVIIIAIFCSTFVSWPIAVVLTLVILLGRWAVNQLGEPSTPQQIWTDITGGKTGGDKTDTVSAKLFTETLSGLNKGLQAMAKVLPDVDRFRVTEDIERGVSIPGRTLLDALWVIAAFGLPLLALSYLFLKNKEVAP